MLCPYKRIPLFSPSNWIPYKRLIFRPQEGQTNERTVGNAHITKSASPSKHHGFGIFNFPPHTGWNSSTHTLRGKGRGHAILRTPHPTKDRAAQYDVPHTYCGQRNTPMIPRICSTMYTRRETMSAYLGGKLGQHTIEAKDTCMTTLHNRRASWGRRGRRQRVSKFSMFFVLLFF